jgi:hypothetical protein
VLLAGGIAASLIAASTTPFTRPADVVTGLALVAMAVALVVRWRVRTAALPAPEAIPGAGPRHRFVWWLALVAAFVAWELFSYLVHGTRADHPTFSSITDAMERFYFLKALLFLAWLAVAGAVVHLTSPARPPSAKP